MFILLLARPLSAYVLLLVQPFHDPFSEGVGHSRVEMNTEQKTFLKKLSPLKNVVLLAPKWFVETHVEICLRSLHLIWSGQHHR